MTHTQTDTARMNAIGLRELAVRWHRKWDTPAEAPRYDDDRTHEHTAQALACTLTQEGSREGCRARWGGIRWVE